MRATRTDEMRGEDEEPLCPGEHAAGGAAARTLGSAQRRRHRGTTRFGWTMWLGMFCISILGLTGVMLSGISAVQPHMDETSPSAHRPAGNGSLPEGAGDEHDEHNDGHGDHEGHDEEVKKEFTLAEQLDLRTDFTISDVPTTREYVFNITREDYAPDGFKKSMILVNGQSPGPLIEANTGDVLRITVHNMMPNDTTTIHWHGIDQRNTAWMDGVHGISQCAIPFGESFTYQFNVTGQRGSFWYHAHVSAQFADGLYGPLIIHDPSEEVPRVDDDKIVLIGDLFYQDSRQLMADYLGTAHPWSAMSGMEPPPDNILLNGQHVSNCSATSSKQSHHSHSGGMSGRHVKGCEAGTLYTTRVHSGHQVRLRLISHSTSWGFWFSIDNHTMEMVEIDGVEIAPIATTRVFMNPGQRYSVIISANQTAGNYRMRATAATDCFHLPHTGLKQMQTLNYEATGIMSYDDVDAEADAIGSAWDLNAKRINQIGREPWKSVCGDLPFNRPKPKRALDAYEVGDRNRHYFSFMRSRGEDNVMRTYVNNTIYAPLTDDATLWKVPEQDLSAQNVNAFRPKWNFGENQLVLVSRDSNMGAQIVINAKAMMMHPFHLHGQNFQVVGWGSGPFGKTTKWNLDNPMRRDTITMNGHDHVVLRIRADNPGIWPLHCHILWHAEEGMFVAVGQRLGELNQMLSLLGATPGQPPFMRRFCSAKSGGLPEK